MTTAKLPPAPAFLASFVHMGFRFPEGSVVVHGALPHRRLNEIFQGLGIPRGPEAETARPWQPPFPPIVICAAVRWPDRQEADEAVIAETVIAIADALLADGRTAITPRLGTRLAGFLQTLREHPDAATIDHGDRP